MSQTFQRNIEDFICSHCGKEIKGNGYTNHCPHCLWSQHVDVNPGDRAAACKGMMKPIAIESSNGKKQNEWIIIHKCVICGHQKRNVMAKDDNMDAAVKITKESKAPQKK